MTIFSKLNATGGIPKQRFVETFTGNAFDTDRWHTGNSTGGTVTMADEIDGGIKIDTGGTQVRTEINFNNKRNFDSQASGCIWVAKTGQTTNTELLFGLADNNAVSSGDVAFVEQHTSNSSNWRLNESFSQWVDTSLTIDTNFHVFKLLLSSSNVTLSIDGILSGTGFATSSAAVNADKLQPELHLHDLSATTNTAQVRYCEAFNT